MSATTTRGYRFFLAFLLFSFLVTACQSNAPEDYAERLCSCYDPTTEAAQQLRIGQLSNSDYELQMVACMGEENPLEALKEDPEALTAFKIGFYRALQEQCPELARSMGYFE
jgi:hypothetical protein